MELKDIKAKIEELRNTATELAKDAYNIYKTTKNPHHADVADFLNYELTTIACKLADLEETEEQETDIDGESESIEDAETIADWWCDLDLQDKCELSNIPYPTTNYGRGDEYIEAEERADKWWNSRTYEQKKEIYEEQLDWWDKE